LRQQQKRIDEMRASARMRARFMRKIPELVEFPRRSVEVTNAGPPGQPPLSSADKPEPRVPGSVK
jgi:hypothetical protein